MADFSILTVSTILLFLLMLIRVTGMVIAAPFFSQNGVPVQVQVGIALALSLILFPIHAMGVPLPATEMVRFFFLAVQELAVGLMLGFVANMFFAAVQVAGNYVTVQMGIGVAHALDPVSNEQSPIMGQFYFILAILLFLGLNIHHVLIIALSKSFEAIPLASGIGNFPLITARFMEMAGEIFVLGVMLILPILGIMLVEEVALAFMSKIMPQMNIFMVALPLKLFSGLVLIYMTLPFTAEAMVKGYDGLVRHLLALYSS